ncbi:MAG TPA: hypothetical protein VFS43_09315 [Polyangiaceae bacterium]|nr:hypothetical protein [Polyangiaceae bacterium]
MITLDDLKHFIEKSKAEAQEQDRIVDQFFDHLNGLAPDASLSFRADALPDVGPRRPLPRFKPAANSGAFLIRG